MNQNKFNFIKNGIKKLPPGFRFQPTDEELVFEYLKRKVLSWPLPASIIPDINVCKYDPWDLPGEMEEEKYVFSSNEAKYLNGNRINRATASGYWKATGLDRQIGSSNKNHEVVGMKKTLVFYRGRHPHASRTDWIMHEYRLVSVATSASKSPPQISSSQLENWVLCRIFLKNKNTANSENLRLNQPIFFDFMSRERDNTVVASVSSSFNSSSITEVSSSGEDDEESSISRKFF